MSPMVESPVPPPAGPEFRHEPVMLAEVVELSESLPGEDFVDATLGGGGHLGAVLEHRPDLTGHGFDRDPSAIDAAATGLEGLGDRVQLHRARFDEAPAILAGLGVERIGGFLMDLGVSSPQIDRPERGFSYRFDGPLDMRMDPSLERTAAEVVNEYELDELIDVLRSYGDERHSVRIARAIVAARPLESTAQLAEVVADAVPAAARRAPGHPAKRTFQAIRIEVNDELSILERSVAGLVEMLAPGGLGMVLTYHSGEDRIVKDVMRRAVAGDDLPGLPAASPFEWAWRGARRPTAAETERNPRSASARLRGIRRREVPA